MVLLSNQAKHIIQDTAKYAESGVRPPIRRDLNNKWTTAQDAMRPSKLGKVNRLLVREKGVNFFKHEKSANIGSAAGTAAALAVGVSTGLTTAASGGLSLAAWAVFLGLKTVYAKQRDKNAAKQVQQSQQAQQGQTPNLKEEHKEMKALACLLSNGDLATLAAKGEKAVTAFAKYADERAKWQRGFAGNRSCGDSCLLAWRAQYAFKRLTQCFHEAESLKRLQRFSQIMTETIADSSQELEDIGRWVCWYCANFPERKSVHDGKKVGGNIPDHGLLRWRVWMQGNQLRVPHKDKFLAELDKGSYDAGRAHQDVKESKFYSDLKDYGSYFARNFAYDATLDMLKSEVALAVVNANVWGGFKNAMVANVGSASTGIKLDMSIANAGVAAATDAIITLVAKWVNDKQNMKQFLGKSKGQHLSFTDRLWVLRSIMEHGRVKELHRCYKSMRENIRQAHKLANFASFHKATLKVPGYKPHTVIPAIIKHLYLAHAAMTRATGLMMFAQRMITEISVSYLSMYNEFEGCKEATLTHINNQTTYDHHACHGTCYQGMNPKAPLA